MDILYIKALHLIFIVTWFAGLFYIVRLFIYHTEAGQKAEPERSILQSHFKLAEKRLWLGITWPSAIGTYIFGIWLLALTYGWNFPGWMFLKLFFVAGLTLYHLLCGSIYKQLQKNQIKYSGFKLRIWNEVASVFLVAIIFIVVLKGQGNWLVGLGGLILFSVLMLVAIKIYKKIREKEE
ncbi:MAG: CopD family protein [Bacteroidetes bacterium]|nr:MAG: CopD family protein [Bacteroidota bacterium]